MIKNITLSAEEELIRKARDKAHRERTTLNATFRQWLERYVARSAKTADFDSFMASLSYAKPGRKFSRDELNER
jgi:hypothetical protein